MTLTLARRSGFQRMPRFIRQYAIPAAQYKEEQGRIINYLQAEDRRMLTEVSHQTKECVAKAEICTEYAQKLHMRIQHESLPGIPVYTLSGQRNLVAEALAAQKRFVSRAETLTEHLDDYLAEPYPVAGEFDEVDFEDEIRSWPREKLEDEHKNITMLVSAQSSRLESSIEALKETARRLEANTGDAMRVVEVRHEKRESPFAAAQPSVLDKAREPDSRIGYGQGGVKDDRSTVLLQRAGSPRAMPNFSNGASTKGFDSLKEKMAKLTRSGSLVGKK